MAQLAQLVTRALAMYLVCFKICFMQECYETDAHDGTGDYPRTRAA